jgi:hypothetical protein
MITGPVSVDKFVKWIWYRYHRSGHEKYRNYIRRSYLLSQNLLRQSTETFNQFIKVTFEVQKQNRAMIMIMISSFMFSSSFPRDDSLKNADQTHNRISKNLCSSVSHQNVRFQKILTRLLSQSNVLLHPWN